MSYIRKRKRNGKVYLEEVESVRIGGKVVQRHLRYIGKEADQKTILSSSISNIKIDQVKVYGPLLALNCIAEKLNLSDMLGVYGDELLSLVYAHCMDYKSINQMSKWFERSDLNMLLDIDDLTEERLLKALDSLESSDLDELQKNIFKKVKSQYKLKGNGVIYDVTNTYLYGKKCGLGKLGKDQDGVKGRPLIQIGLGVTRKEGIPIFHKTFDGNISDTRTLTDLITGFSLFDINSGIIIYDRGISSAANIKALKKRGWGTICGLPSNNKLKEAARNLISTKALIDFKNRTKMNNTVFYSLSKKHSIGDIRGVLLICYNEQKAKDLRESRYDEIENARALLREKKSIKNELKKYFYKNNTINKKVIEKEEEFDGFSFIFSTEQLTDSEILSLYFQDKYIVEKAFRSLKGVVKVRPIRHWLYNRVIAHVFICYLSYLLLSLLKFNIKKINISPVAALQELETLYKVYISDQEKGFKLERTVALSKKQEKILKCIDKELISKCSG